MNLGFNGTFRITREFGVKDPAYANYPNSQHPGTDFDLPSDTPLFAGMPGVVTAIIRGKSKMGRGNEVVITNGNKQLKYCHMNEISVKTGQTVKPGDPIGLSGYTGYVVDWRGNIGTKDGAHLHLEYLEDSEYKDVTKHLKEEDVNKFTKAQINRLTTIALNRQAHQDEKDLWATLPADEVLQRLEQINKPFRTKAANYDTVQQATLQKIKTALGL